MLPAMRSPATAGCWGNTLISGHAAIGSSAMPMSSVRMDWCWAASAPFVIVPIVLAFTSPAPAGAETALRTVLLIASGLLPGIGSIMNEYSERLALGARARQYDRMRMLFERASELLPEQLEQGKAALTRAIYLELGQEAMRENAEWVSTYRQRPIQPPK